MGTRAQRIASLAISTKQAYTGNVTPRTKPRPKTTRTPRRSSSAKANGRIRHLHVVIDDELEDGVKAHACKLEGVPNDSKSPRNLSASVRDLLRRALKLIPNAAT